MTKYPTIAFSSLFLLLTLSGCQYSEQDKTYTYSDEWTIDYPSFLRKSTVVYPGSELQLANGYRDTYIFVREVIVTMPAESLKDSLAAKLMDNLKDARIESETTSTINGAEFRTLEITGLLQDVRMYYLLSIIQFDDKIYHYSGWMFNHKRDLWEADYKKMLNSWRPLKANS